LFGFLRRQALLDKYAVELPLLQRGDQVKKAILKIKSQGAWFKLEGVRKPITHMSRVDGTS
jgi:hypothetical protein